MLRPPIGSTHPPSGSTHPLTLPTHWLRPPMCPANFQTPPTIMICTQSWAPPTFKPRSHYIRPANVPRPISSPAHNIYTHPCAPPTFKPRPHYIYPQPCALFYDDLHLLNTHVATNHPTQQKYTPKSDCF